MSIGERIKKLRKMMDLTQRKFGERIGIKGNTVAQYELGRNEPIDAVLSLICREFNVNEEWLRTGEGEIFIQKTQNQIITDFLGDVIKDDDSFKKRIVESLASFEPEDWKDLERLLMKFIK